MRPWSRQSSSFDCWASFSTTQSAMTPMRSAAAKPARLAVKRSASSWRSLSRCGNCMAPSFTGKLGGCMKHVCDAPAGKTWFRIETEAEAADESKMMRHAVEKYFCSEQAKAAQSFQPPSSRFIEQEIGLKAHLQREMPLFLTLRDQD